MVHLQSNEYCILLAEDNAIIRYAVAKEFVERGYCVLQASDAAEALRLQDEYDGTIHVVITDVEMSGIDGHTLARESKRKRPDLKVLILSSHREVDFPDGANGHDRALVKPVPPQVVVSQLEKLLRERGPPPGGLATHQVSQSQNGRLRLYVRGHPEPCSARACCLETRLEIKVSEVP